MSSEPEAEIGRNTGLTSSTVGRVNGNLEGNIANIALSYGLRMTNNHGIWMLPPRSRKCNAKFKLWRRMRDKGGRAGVEALIQLLGGFR